MTLIPYTLLILILTAPQRREHLLSVSVKELLMLLLALLSAAAIPWSGVSFATLHDIPSSIFLPLTALYIIFAKSGCQQALRSKAVLFLTAAVSVAALLYFIQRVGVPGEFGSVESLCSIIRLESIRTVRLITALIVLASAMTLALAQIRLKESWSSSVIRFTYSGFIVNLTCPVRTAELLKLSPQLSIALDAVILLLLSLAFKNIVIIYTEKLLIGSDRRAANTATPILFALVGCYFLLTEI